MDREVAIKVNSGARAWAQGEPAIELHGVTKRFRTPSGGFYTAVRDLSFSVGRGEFCCIVGPTGSGKSTTLGLISGLDAPSRGQVLVMGEPVKGVTRRAAYMFQTDAIFPWKSLEQRRDGAYLPGDAGGAGTPAGARLDRARRPG
jgi:ABC-type glutathione transport system ATPase component